MRRSLGRMRRRTSPSSAPGSPAFRSPTSSPVPERGHRLDRGPIGGGMTARTTGHLASELDDYYHVLIEARGVDAAREVCARPGRGRRSHRSDRREEGIECDFARLDGYLFLVPRPTDGAREEYAAARRVGLAVDWADEAPIPGVRTGRSLRFATRAGSTRSNISNGLVGAWGRRRAAVRRNHRERRRGGGGRQRGRAQRGGGARMPALAPSRRTRPSTRSRSTTSRRPTAPTRSPARVPRGRSRTRCSGIPRSLPLRAPTAGRRWRRIG